MKKADHNLLNVKCCSAGYNIGGKKNLKKKKERKKFNLQQILQRQKKQIKITL